MKIKSDVVIDLLWGDGGKGKCVSHFLSQKDFWGLNKYDYCFRHSVGGNCGHSIYINNKKFITHLIPAGVFHNIKSIIGCGCVLNVNKFFEELNYLENNGIECRHLIKIAYNAHIITDKHIEEDIKNEESGNGVGSTKQGIMPAYRDKYARIGIRAESIPELKPFLVDVYDELYNRKNNIRVLFEGAQGVYLCVNNCSTYPYATSADCSIGSVISNGVPPQSIDKVFGIIKAYASYVGSLKFQPEGKIYERIQEVGKEIGATTGRKRQVDFININLINRAIDMNGANILIVNKMDILQQIGVWNIYKDDQLIELQTESNFKKFLKKNIRKSVKIIFSYSPKKI